MEKHVTYTPWVREAAWHSLAWGEQDGGGKLGFPNWAILQISCGFPGTSLFSWSFQVPPASSADFIAFYDTYINKPPVLSHTLMSTFTTYADSAQSATAAGNSNGSSNVMTPEPQNQAASGAGEDEGGKKKKATKRRKVNHACLYCRRSHMTCDEGRPCQRW